jgi:Cu-Zn family superoxide dismutase
MMGTNKGNGMALHAAVAALMMAASIVLAASLAQAADPAFTVLKDKDGKEVGKATLTDTPNGVLIRLDLGGVPAGDQAFHVHQTGKCEPPDFKSAGGHFNPDGTKHGIMNPEGPHAGDMPNLHVPEGGKLTVEVLNTLVSLDGERALLDDDGSALVIHAGPDDYTSDPAGHAGDRIACGVVAK